jgi:TonB family protein
MSNATPSPNEPTQQAQTPASFTAPVAETIATPVGAARKYLWLWINVALVHGVLIAALWFPQPLHLPSREDIVNAWQDAKTYIDRHWLHPEEYRRQVQAEQLAAQRRIAELPPALITRAEPKNRVYQIRCPQSARTAKLHGSVFIVADITAQGTVGKAMIVEPSPNTQVNQLILQSFNKAQFKPAVDEHNHPAPDQIHFNWPYDCR